MAALIGAIAMTGWILSIDILKSVVPGLITMKANTALCLVITGVALALLAVPGASPRVRLAARVSAAGVGILALVVFSQFVHGRDLGVDLFLFHEPQGQVGTAHAGRMAFNTCVAFMLASVALLLLGARRGTGLIPAIAIAIVAMSFMALVGYLAGVNSLYAIAKKTQMAVPTASAFLLIGSGLLAAQPQRAPMRLLCAADRGGTLFRRLLPVVVIVPVALGLLRLEGQEIGFYDTATGTWLMVLSIVFLTLPATWMAASSLSRADAERSRSDAARREAEEHFRLSFEQAGIGMAVTSLDGRWLNVNSALCELTGYSAERLKQLTWQEITHPDDVPADSFGRASVVDREAHSFQNEKRYLRASGGYVWANITGALIRDDAGQPLHWVTQIVDVTDRRRAEEEAAAARDSAIEASRLKSEFLANMSHEIRTPMNGVIGMTELLLDTKLSEEQHEYARLLRTSGETLMGIVNEILDLSKIEAGKLEIDTLDFALASAVEDVGELMADRAHEKGVALSVLVEAGVPARAHGDEIRVRQILTNLVSNAVKFTAEGEVRIRASLAERPGGNHTVRFDVTDTGIGIEADQVEHLFDPFTQADSSTTRVYGGTGLGLTIARQLTEMMGGEIGATSRPGEGSHFWFMLPFEAAAPGQPPAAPPAGNLAGRRILVVDDSETNRTIVAHHATSWGMRIDAAHNAPDALGLMRLAAAEGDPFAFVALDMHMPGMNGLELAREVKADPALLKIHLMLLTSSFEGRQLAREAGVSYVLRKPIRRSRLLDALLHRGPVEQTLRVPTSGPNAGPNAGASVLVAEDNEINRLLAVRMLARRGIRADVAPDGRVAVAMVKERHYDAVLMDCHMPVMDGYDAVRAIRGAERDGERLPVIAVSASSMPDDRRRAIAAGMDDFVAKPLDHGLFDAMLARWLGDGAAAAEPIDRSYPEVPAAGSTDPLDFNTIEQLRSDLGDDAVVRKLLGLFRDQTEARLETVERAVAAGDAEELRIAAHTIKGGAASVGAPGVSDAARALEDAATEGQLAGAADLGVQLRTEFERCKTALANQEVMT